MAIDLDLKISTSFSIAKVEIAEEKDRFKLQKVQKRVERFSCLMMEDDNKSSSEDDGFMLNLIPKSQNVKKQVTRRQPIVKRAS